MQDFVSCCYTTCLWWHFNLLLLVPYTRVLHSYACIYQVLLVNKWFCSACYSHSLSPTVFWVLSKTERNLHPLRAVAKKNLSPVWIVLQNFLVKALTCLSSFSSRALQHMAVSSVGIRGKTGPELAITMGKNLPHLSYWECTRSNIAVAEEILLFVGVIVEERICIWEQWKVQSSFQPVLVGSKPCPSKIQIPVVLPRVCPHVLITLLDCFGTNGLDVHKNRMLIVTSFYVIIKINIQSHLENDFWVIAMWARAYLGNLLENCFIFPPWKESSCPKADSGGNF